MLDTGLWLTFTSYCLKMSKSSSSMQTQCTRNKIRSDKSQAFQMGYGPSSPYFPAVLIVIL